jgi:2-oxoglutarate ferredoxin oxidoreductase subunit alpha
MSTKNRAVVWIGGAAGDGIASTGDIFCKTASRMGMWVCAYNSYQSVIRGGHVYYQVQIGGGDQILSHGDQPDVLLALNQDTIDRHAEKVLEGGAIIFNKDKIKLEGLKIRPNVQIIAIPVDELTKEYGRNPVMQNTVDSGALINILGLDWAIFEESINSIFGKKKSEIAQLNINLAKKGAEFAKANAKPLNIALKGDGKKRGIVTGNAMLAFGALTGGCKFYAAYPMTPASSVMHWLAPRASKYGMVMKHVVYSLINIALLEGKKINHIFDHGYKILVPTGISADIADIVFCQIVTDTALFCLFLEICKTGSEVLEIFFRQSEEIEREPVGRFLAYSRKAFKK